MPEFYLLARNTKDSKSIKIEGSLNIFINKNNDLCFKYKRKSSTVESTLKKPCVEKVNSSEKLEVSNIAEDTSSRSIEIPIIFKDNKIGFIFMPQEKLSALINFINKDTQKDEQFNPYTVSIKMYSTNIDITSSDIISKKLCELPLVKIKQSETKELLQQSSTKKRDSSKSLSKTFSNTIYENNIDILY